MRCLNDTAAIVTGASGGEPPAGLFVAEDTKDVMQRTAGEPARGVPVEALGMMLRMHSTFEALKCSRRAALLSIASGRVHGGKNHIDDGVLR